MHPTSKANVGGGKRRDSRDGRQDWPRLHGALAAAAKRGPVDFPRSRSLGIGARTVRSLGMVVEVIHGAPYRFRDPARFSLAHGGKDHHPYPCSSQSYDETIRVMKIGGAQRKLGREEEMQALRAPTAPLACWKAEPRGLRSNPTWLWNAPLAHAERQVRVWLGAGSVQKDLEE
jgi:hypothetical protein